MTNLASPLLCVTLVVMVSEGSTFWKRSPSWQGVTTLGVPITAVLIWAEPAWIGSPRVPAALLTTSFGA